MRSGGAPSPLVIRHSFSVVIVIRHSDYDFLILTSLAKIIAIVFLVILPMVSYSVYASAG
jgi:hypothetical protein